MLADFFMNYKQSIIGFRTKSHDSLTSDEFLRLYVNSLHKKRFKRNGIEFIRLAEFIERNWDDQIKFVTRLFPTAPKEAEVGGQKSQLI